MKFFQNAFLKQGRSSNGAGKDNLAGFNKVTAAEIAVPTLFPAMEISRRSIGIAHGGCLYQQLNIELPACLYTAAEAMGILLFQAAAESLQHSRTTCYSFQTAGASH